MVLDGFRPFLVFVLITLVYLHVNPCRAVKLRETSMLVHLQIISAESDKITESKLKLLYVKRAS